MDKVTWRGTPGVGDFMMALNCVHLHAYETSQKVNLEMHWEHDEDYYHHFEDPETIVERMEYIHNLYHDKDMVEVTHVFNSQGRYSDWSYWDDIITDPDGSRRCITKRRDKSRFWFESGRYSDDPGKGPPPNNWLFREDLINTPTQKNKVVIWRPTFNAEMPRYWKRVLTNDQWERIISKLRSGGLNIVELSYRTPVREAVYHIATSRMVVCYDGMWHYIARNFSRPTAVISGEGITKYHTPNAIRYDPTLEKEPSIHMAIEEINNLLGDTKRQSRTYYEKVKYIYGDLVDDYS